MKIIGTICILFLWVGADAQMLERYEYSRPLMGTTFRIILYTSDSIQASGSAEAAFDRVMRLNTIMSDYQSDSELNRLSAKAGSGEKVPVSEDLWLVLKEARHISKRTKGAFDVSIGPLSKLWRRAFRQRTFPSPEKITKASHLVDYRKIRLYPKGKRVQVKVKGMRLDLGGIAKGFAADEAYRVLVEEFDIEIALVDAGGDLVLGAAPPNQTGWEIEIQTEKIGEEKNQRLSLHHCAIATSGDSYKYLEYEGKRYSHIIDPKIGKGMTDRRQVTVISSHGMLADAWASAMSVYPIQKIPAKWFRSESPCQFAQIIHFAETDSEVFTFGSLPNK